MCLVLIIGTADFYGNWEGSVAYQPLYAFYNVALFDFRATSESYGRWMSGIGSSIAAIGKAAQSQDLARNLVYWSSWSVRTATIGSTGSSADQLLQMTGEASIIFRRPVDGTVANIHTDCTVSISSESYNYASQLLTMSFNITAFNEDPTCATAVNPSILGYNARHNGDTFSIVMDTQALMSSASVTYAVNGNASLGYFSTFQTVAQGVFHGVSYTAVKKYDSNYPGTKPITCIGPTNGIDDSQWTCLMSIGASYGLPFFVHRGTNTQYPSPCDCSDGSGQSPACDEFDFLEGLIVYDYTSNRTVSSAYPAAFQPFLPLLELLYVHPAISALTANENVFYPAFAAIFPGAAEFTDPAWREKHYSFCRTKSFGYCSIVVYRSFSPDNDTTVSLTNYQLNDGACANSFETPYFSSLEANSWGTLEENYVQCTLNNTGAFFTSIGISIGTAGILAPILAMILIYATMTGIAIATGVHEEVQNAGAKYQVLLDKEKEGWDRIVRRRGSRNGPEIEMTAMPSTEE
jgi:hypothetical protein